MNVEHNRRVSNSHIAFQETSGLSKVDDKAAGLLKKSREKRSSEDKGEEDIQDFTLTLISSMNEFPSDYFVKKSGSNPLE